jgi:two-component system NarL family sensor kinase
MLNTQQEIFNTLELITIFFILLISIIITTAILYHNRKKIYLAEVENFQNILLQSQWEVQEHTLQTIGGELHDNIGQLLSLTNLTLHSIELNEHEKALQKIGSVIDLNKQSIRELRSLGKLLQGQHLISKGLEEAIHLEIDWIEKAGRFKIIHSINGEKPSFSNQDKDLILFRIIQETINNAIKHSDATTLKVLCIYLEMAIKVIIADDGIGFDVGQLDSKTQGLGLQNIQKRTQVIGGSLSIESSPGKGTSIEIIVPYP